MFLDSYFSLTNIERRSHLEIQDSDANLEYQDS